MALTNNEKQIRHKKLEELKKYGNQVLLNTIFMNQNSFTNPAAKPNEELKSEIESIIDLPSGWTDEDLKTAYRKLDSYQNDSYENPHLMDNDINSARSILDPNFNMDELKRALFKAPEVVRNIRSTLRLSELNKSDQIAVLAELMRELARELLNENRVPKTFANATALSLIGHQYAKPKWTWNILARNLFTQNTKEYTDKLILELQKPEMENGSLIFANE